MALAAAPQQRLQPERLEYRVAFDLATATLSWEGRAHHPVLLLASAAVFVQEALLRLDGPLTIVAESNQVVAPCCPSRDSSMDGPAAIRALVGDIEPWVVERHPAAIWASPQATSWQRRLRALDASLADDALLVVLAAGGMAWLLSRFAVGSTPGEPRWPVPGLRHQLVSLGYRLGPAYGLGGARAFAWAAMSRMAGMLRRPDLAHRCDAGYLQALTCPRSTRFAMLALQVAHREKRR